MFDGYFIMEQWKTIESHPQYEISNFGNLRYKINKDILKFSKNKKGYFRIKLYCLKNKESKCFSVHQLVAIYFLNHKLDGTMKRVIDHIDGDKENNIVTNLQITTNRNNCAKSKTNKTSRFTNVAFDKFRNKWSAEIREKQIRHKLGRFNCETSAFIKVLIQKAKIAANGNL